MVRRSAFLFLLCAGALLAFAGAAPAARIWLPAQTLTATDSKAPSVAVAPDGTTVLAWSRVDGATTVVEAVRRRPGQAFGTPVKLSAAEGSNPRVGIDAAGNATIAWEEDGVGVRAARLPAATGFEAATTVVANGSGAELAVGAGGTAVVVAQVAGVLQAAIRPGASGAFGAATPISAGTALDPDVAVAPDGRAAVAWLEGGDVLLNERPAGGSFAAAGTIRSRDVDAYEVSEPAVAVEGSGRSIVVWTEDDLGTPAEGTYLNSSVAPGAWVSYWHPTSRSADLATGPGGAVVGAWVETAFLEVGDLTPGTSSWTNFGVADPAPAAGTAPAVTVGGDNATVATWASGSGVHAARRAAGTNLLTSAQLATGAGAGSPSVGADDQGNATTAWLSPGRRIAVSSFDNAVPVLSGVSVPATARAGGPALAMSAAASDRLGPVTLHWTFGDGATATGSAVRHAFSAAGTYQVGVMAVDAAGNSSRAVRSVTVAAAPKPPARPQVARVAASVDLGWRVRGKQIKLERMRLTRMPAGAEAELRCKGKRCPIRRTRIFTPSKRGVINVVKPLEIDQRRFRAGQRLDLRISAPGHVGQVLRFNLVRGKQPKALQRCMPIGSTRIRQSC